MSPNPPFIYAPPDTPLDVIHLDDQILAINKPSGLLSVPGKAMEHRDCLETRVKAVYPDALLVHRLDMDTSGVMVFGIGKAAQRHINIQFQKTAFGKDLCGAGCGPCDRGCGASGFATYRGLAEPPVANG
jgi:23S rRNA-/tRNA-specific pseudouridylate synthase